MKKQYTFKMKNICILLFAMLLPISMMGQKPRLLVSTDIGGDPDDQQAVIRLMVHANEFDLEGLVTSVTERPGNPKVGVVCPELLREIIQGYEQVYPNLLKHDTAFPSPAYLFSIVKNGSPTGDWDHVGEGHDTEGSGWIIKMVDKKDERPLNICLFGGQTDLAQALWKVKSSRPAGDYRKFISKIRVYDVSDQDHIFKQMFAEHPSLFYILSNAPQGHDMREGAYRGVYLGGDESLTSLQWLKEMCLKTTVRWVGFIPKKHGHLQIPMGP